MSAPMVRSTLDDSKNQTRRIVSPQPAADEVIKVLSKTKQDDGEFALSMWLAYPQGESISREKNSAITSPYGIRGDHLLVKESAWMWCERVPFGKTPKGRPKWSYQPMKGAPIFYAADHPEKPQQMIASPHTGNEWGWRFKVGRFIPGWAVRIELEVQGVRIERLHDITDEDAWAEGIDTSEALSMGCTEGAARAAYSALWERIHGEGSWDVNPWVWVVIFRRLPGAPMVGKKGLN